MKSNSNELPISVPLSIFSLFQKNVLKIQKAYILACLLKVNQL